HHGDFEDGHDLTAFEAEHGDSDDLVSVSVDDDFHEAARLIDLERSRHTGHRHLGHADVLVLLARRALGESDAPKLGIDEDNVWNRPAFGRDLLLLNQVRANDTEVVVGNVSERWATLDVA